jgi:hypothetical protein
MTDRAGGATPSASSPERSREDMPNPTPPADDWYLWGPYLSERQWGTVREDYSADGGAWS